MKHNILEFYNLHNILIEAGINPGIKIDHNDLSDFKNKFQNITSDLEKNKENILKNEKLKEEFINNLRDIIDFIESLTEYLDEDTLSFFQKKIKNYNLNKSIHGNELKELLKDVSDFNELIKDIENSKIEDWIFDFNNIYKKIETQDLYSLFKEGYGFINIKDSSRYSFFHEKLLYDLTLKVTNYDNNKTCEISFDAIEFDVDFKTFIDQYFSISGNYKDRVIKDTNILWKKIMTMIKYFSEQNSDVSRFSFLGIDDTNPKSPSITKKNAALHIFNNFNKILIANLNDDIEINAQEFIDLLDEQDKDNIKILKEIILRINFNNEQLLESEEYLNQLNNNNIQSINELIDKYKKEIKILENFIKNYKIIKKELNSFKLNYNYLKNLNNELASILSKKDKINEAQQLIRKALRTASYEFNTKDTKSIALYFSQIKNLKYQIIIYLITYIIKNEIKKEKDRLSKKLKEKNINFNVGKILKKISAIIYNLIKYFNVFDNLNEPNNKGYDFILAEIENRIKELSNSQRITFSKDKLKQALIKTIDEINEKYKYTIKHKDFDTRLKTLIKNLPDEKYLIISVFSDTESFSFFPDYNDETVKNKNITSPKYLIQLTPKGKLAIMSSRSKRYYAILKDYGIKEENIDVDSNNEVTFKI